MEGLNFLRESWATITMVTGGIFSAITAWYQWRKNRKNSTNLLYDQLEELKKQIIENVKREVHNAKELAQKDYMLEMLRKRCPDCYQKVIDQIREDEKSI